MSKLTQSQKEQLKKHVISCVVRQFTGTEIQQFIKDEMHIEISASYLRCLRLSLKNDMEKQLKSYAIDRTAYINECFFKRLAELENSQQILYNIIERNEDKPEAQIKAVAQLNEITVLIANLFELLPAITRLGIDAFSPSIITDDISNNITTSTTSSSVGPVEESKEFDSRYSV